MLKNPYTRIAVAAALSTFIAPRVFNAFASGPETNPGDGLKNDAMFAGIQGATAAFVYVLLSMTLGAPAAA